MTSLSVWFIFGINLTGSLVAQLAGKTLFLRVSVRVFPEERLALKPVDSVKRMALPSVGDSTAGLTRAKGGGRVSSLSLTVELGLCSTPVLVLGPSDLDWKLQHQPSGSQAFPLHRCGAEKTLFFFFLIRWRLIILQHCSGFCHTLT